MKETVDTFQNLYQIRNVTEIILPDNHMDRFEKLRFNMVIIIIIITTATIITTKKHKTGLIRIVVFSTLTGLQLSNELLSISFFYFLFLFLFRSSIFSGIVDTQQRDGNKFTNWRVVSSKVSRICTEFGQS